MGQTTEILGLVALAVGAGASFVLQQAVNADLRTSLNSAAWAGFVSYLGGALCMLALALLLREEIPPSSKLKTIALPPDRTPGRLCQTGEGGRDADGDPHSE